MNKILKRLLLGLIIWAIPFFSSFFVWNLKQNTPSVSNAWFNALMAVTWAIGFSIAAYFYFKDVNKKDATNQGYITGLVWYFEMLTLDLIFLVGMLGMSFKEYIPVLFTYTNVIYLSIAIGYIIAKK